MRSNSSRVVKLYSRPFSSDPRGDRVVHEIAKSMPPTCLRNSLTSVLLPEPDGAEMINRMPATYLDPSLSGIFVSVACPLVPSAPASFHVLNLFPRLLDLCFHGQPQLGNPRAFPADARG